MAIKKLFFIIVCLFISACSQNIEHQKFDTFELSESNDFSIKSKIKFEHKYIRQDHSIAYTNFSAPKFNWDINDVSVEIYENSSLCTTTIMGTNTIETYARDTGGKTVFGIVSSKEHPYEMQSFNDALCLPPRTSDDADSYWRNHGYDGAGAYVLCSEKGEKTVLICISQMTDNPQLVEEIFSTFRWTE